MWELRAGATILIYAPHGKLNGNRTIRTTDGLMFDHFPYKLYVTPETKRYHEIQVRTPSQIACGKLDIPEAAYHHVIHDNKFIVMVRNHRNRRCYALVNTEDMEYVGEAK